jgi:hypothetical protein
MQSQIYRYSPFNWIIETQYSGDINNVINFLDKTDGVFYKKGLSTSKNLNQYWFLGKGANYSHSAIYQNIINSIKNQTLRELKYFKLLFEEIYLDPFTCWSVTGTKGGFHKIHDHGLQNLICSIVYTKVPEVMEDEEGYTFFIMSNDIRHQNYASVPKSIEIKPEIGKMIIFPSHILHGVYPYPEGIRQTFNLDFNLLEGNKEYEYH